MILKQRAIIFCCILSLIPCTSWGVQLPHFLNSSAADETERLALTQKTLDHLHQLDATLAQLASKAEGNILACSDSAEFLERIDFLRNLMSQVVFCVERPSDKKALQFLCALSTTMLECIEWLSRGEDAVGVDLNLDKIKVDNFPDDLHALDSLVTTNVQRCKELSTTIDALHVGFFTRMFRRAKNMARVIASYTVQSKIFAGVGVSVVGLYLLARIRARDEDMGPGSYALTRRNKCGKTEITAHNLYSHVPHGSLMLQHKVRSWFTTNKDAWQVFVEQPGGIRDYCIKQAKIDDVIADKDLDAPPSQQYHANILFALPNAPEWLVKISGPVNRARLQEANQDKDYGRVDLVDTTKMVPTYQTASRSMGAVKLKEAIKKYKLDELEPIECCLWSPTKQCNDTQCVVLEKRIAHLKLLKEYSQQELATLLTEKKIGQLLLAAKHVGLWNLTDDNIGVNTVTGKLVLFDLEQPNTTKVVQQFNKDEKRYLHNVNSGVQSLYQILPIGSKMRDDVEAWARRDSEIMSADNNANDLLPLFEANKKAIQDALKLAQENSLKQTQEEARKIQETPPSSSLKQELSKGKKWHKPEGEI